MLNTKMPCPLQTENADVLLDYCARSLDPERQAMLEKHMENCAHCREMASAQSEVWSAMDLYDAEAISADFDRKLYGRIEEFDLDKVSSWERFWAPVREYLQGRPGLKPVLSVAAASAVLAFVFVIQSDVSQPVVEPAAAIDVREVEQAERALEDIEMLRQFDVAVPADSTGANAQKEVL
ncbi:MAG: zf-HC2 domain-containing protein [Bryobacteraceae bacterium]